jgi:hypothetical protein
MAALALWAACSARWHQAMASSYAPNRLASADSAGRMSARSGVRAATRRATSRKGLSTVTRSGPVGSGREPASRNSAFAPRSWSMSSAKAAADPSDVASHPAAHGLPGSALATSHSRANASLTTPERANTYDRAATVPMYGVPATGNRPSASSARAASSSRVSYASRRVGSLAIALPACAAAWRKSPSSSAMRARASSPSASGRASPTPSDTVHLFRSEISSEMAP